MRAVCVNNQNSENSIASDSCAKCRKMQEDEGNLFGSPEQSRGKKIKIKAIFPKGFLKNFELESFKTKFTAELINFAKNMEDSPDLLVHPNTCGDCQVKTSNQTNSIVATKPIMGKSALLAKRALNETYESRDATIVTKIVMEKFKTTLNYYYRRSFNRTNSRRRFVNDRENNVCPDDEPTTDSQNVTSHWGKVLEVSVLGGSQAKTDSNSTNNDDLDFTFSVDHQANEKQGHKDDLAAPELPASSKVEGQNYTTTDSDSASAKEDIDLVVSLDQIIKPRVQKQLLVAKGHQEQDFIFDRQAECSEDERLFEEKIEYDSQQFLELALGDENYSTADSQYGRSMAAVSTTSIYNDNSSISTARVSTLMSKSSSLYSVFSRKMRLSSQSSTSSLVEEKPPTDYAASSSLDSKASLLMHEAAVQHQIIMQTSKALNICLSSKEFKSSIEYVEAEKILLLAIQKREEILKELVKGEYEDVDNNESSCLGHLTLSNLTFSLTGVSREGTRWFFASVRCGTNILATEVAMADQMNEIRFQKSFCFEDLNSDFEIVVSIYSLTIKHNGKNGNYDSKLHTKKETTMCPSPNKLINFHKSSRQYPRYSYARRQPSFVLQGSTIIRIFDLNKPSPFKLWNVPRFSGLQEVMQADLSSSVDFSGTCSGFLTIGSEAGGFASWNRRWCHLQGYKLHYWNYPAEEELIDPIESIDLSYCVTSHISPVDREFCARPRTLLVETGRLSTPRDRNSLMVLCKSSYTITRHYLSADNNNDMVIWQKRLNAVVGSLRSWNCMNCQLFF